MDIERKLIYCTANNKAKSGSSSRKPNQLRVILGISLITISYILGWPAVSAIAALSVYIDKPSLITYGGPLIYGLSYILFFIGLYFTGKKQAKLFYDWLKCLASRFLMVG